MRHYRIGLPLALVMTAACGSTALAEDFKSVCEQLVRGLPEAGRVTEATFVPAGPVALPAPGPSGAAAPAPDHCLVRGKINERTGIDGKPYAIGYEIRLPANWNGKFLFEGGGGSDGVLRPALDVIPFGAPKPNALSAGYVAATTDAGHLDEPGPIGPYLFGLDPKARADKGYSSIPPVTAAAKALIGKLYGKAPSRAYFAGCSNGGRQAMAVTTALSRDVRRRRGRSARLPRPSRCDRCRRSYAGIDVDCAEGGGWLARSWQRSQR